MPQLFEGEAVYTDDTHELFVNIGGEIVNMNGSRWEIGTALSGTDAETEYDYSDCPLVKPGDMYLNTSSGNVYQCITAGKGNAAKWTYKGCMKTSSEGGGSISDGSITAAMLSPALQNQLSVFQEHIDNPVSDDMQTIKVSEQYNLAYDRPTSTGITPYMFFMLTNDTDEDFSIFQDYDDRGLVLSEPLAVGESRVCIITKLTVGGADPENGYVYVAPDEKVSSGGSITVDSALSSTSTNPVQNKVINSALNGKASASHTHTKSQITDLTGDIDLTIDSELSTTSTNPVQNKVITKELNSLFSKMINTAFAELIEGLPDVTSDFVYQEDNDWYYCPPTQSSSGWYYLIESPFNSNTDVYSVFGETYPITDYVTGASATLKVGDEIMFKIDSSSQKMYIIRPSITWAEFFKAMNTRGF